MSLLLALIVGSIIGGVGGFMLQENFDLLFMNILLGIAGAVLGDAIFFFTDTGNSYLLFSWGGLLSQIVGALILVGIFSLLHRVASDRTELP